MTTADWSDADMALLAEVYDLECKSRMNVLYYGKRLGRLQAISFWMEVLIAATASGSGLAAIAVVKTQPGQWLWQTLALIAAIVSIIRPIYAPGKKIEVLTRQLHGYHANFFGLMKLATSIRQEGAMTIDHRRRYDTFFDRHVELSNEDDFAPSRRALMEARELTNQELPPERFWWPQPGPTDVEPQSQTLPRESARDTAAADLRDDDPEVATSGTSVFELPSRHTTNVIGGKNA